jgi:hypothetical protein
MRLLEMGKELRLPLKFQSMYLAEQGRTEEGRRGKKHPRREARRTQRRQTARPAKEEVTFVEHKRLVPSPEEGPAKTPAMGKAKPTRPSAEAGRTNAVMEASAVEAALEAAHPWSPAPRTEPTYG